MTDVVVTVPKGLWAEWIGEGDLPGDAPSGYESHFWIRQSDYMPAIHPGERVYIVAHGRLRGYAPLRRTEHICRLAPTRSCFVRDGGAVAVTIPEPIVGFRGWRYRWWDRSTEQPFEAWRTEAVA
jgi:hypothetical protein